MFIDRARVYAGTVADQPNLLDSHRVAKWSPYCGERRLLQQSNRRRRAFGKRSQRPPHRRRA
jgi:hypothetical protein